MPIFKVKELNFKAMNRWLEEAEKHADDHVHAFICVWIAFSFFLYAYVNSKFELFRKRFRLKDENHIIDSKRILFLVDQDDFKACFEEFKRFRPEALKGHIHAPVLRPLRAPPDKLPKQKKSALLSFSAKGLLLELNSVRNNLLHGHKDPWENLRDMKLCRVGAQVMIPLVGFILDNTSGETLYAQEERESLNPSGSYGDEECAFPEAGP